MTACRSIFAHELVSAKLFITHKQILHVSAHICVSVCAICVPKCVRLTNNSSGKLFVLLIPVAAVQTGRTLQKNIDSKNLGNH